MYRQQTASHTTAKSLLLHSRHILNFPIDIAPHELENIENAESEHEVVQAKNGKIVVAEDNGCYEEICMKPDEDTDPVQPLQ